MADSFVHILIIDDQKADAELATIAIRKHSSATKIYHVEDGDSALQFLLGKGKFRSRSGVRPPDLIFLDLNLPMVDGFEILGKIRAHQKTKYVPTVVFSSSAEPSDIKKAYELGANSYLTKPIGFREFTSAVLATCRYWLNCNSNPF